MEEVAQLKKRLQDFFGGAFLAQGVGEHNEYSARSVLRVMGHEDGVYVAYLFPNPAMSLELRITEIQENKDDWLVSTNNKGQWSFRKLSPEDLAAYKKAMNSEGFRV